jgi:hypothetical protein
MIVPVSFFLVLITLAIAATWWWIARVPVTPPLAPMLALRIAFPGGVRLADPELAVAGLARPDEIVIPFERAELRISYPLTVPASVPLEATLRWGFTRGELVRSICEEYANVYEAEEGTAATPTVPIADRTRSERNRTDGAYGIWGYDLDALVLTAVRWTRGSDGGVVIEPYVEAHPRAAGAPPPAG